MKSITTTGEHLMEDVLMTFTCWSCDGAGYMLAVDPQDEEPVCLDCNSTGLNLGI